MKEACVCYVVDDAYLLPTLVSAAQATKNISETLADVIIACIGTRSALNDAARQVAEQLGIGFQLVSRDQINNLHPMYGRLFVDDFLPRQYSRVIYIDGDTQIKGDLSPLATAPMLPSTFWAVRDPSNTFARLSHEWMERILSDRGKVNYSEHYDDYFNSGVLVINRDGWGALAKQCLAFLEGIRAPLPHPDQDILNLAVGGHCVRIPNRWNFPGFLIGTAAEKTSDPHIYHFMSNPRPWIHAVMPWGKKWQAPYDDLLLAFPQLAPMRPKRSLFSAAKYHVQQEIKLRREYRPVGSLTESEAEFKI